MGEEIVLPVVFELINVEGKNCHQGNTIEINDPVSEIIAASGPSIICIQ